MVNLQIQSHWNANKKPAEQSAGFLYLDASQCNSQSPLISQGPTYKPTYRFSQTQQRVEIRQPQASQPDPPSQPSQHYVCRCSSSLDQLNTRTYKLPWSYSF